MRGFVEGGKSQLGISARYRDVEACMDGQGYTLREPAVAYRTHFGPENVTLSDEKTLISWIKVNSISGLRWCDPAPNELVCDRMQNDRARHTPVP
jgi:hypothetical protein